jgi:hypothetical protein
MNYSIGRLCITNKNKRNIDRFQMIWILSYKGISNDTCFYFACINGSATVITQFYLTTTSCFSNLIITGTPSYISTCFRNRKYVWRLVAAIYINDKIWNISAIRYTAVLSTCLMTITWPNCTPCPGGPWEPVSPLSPLSPCGPWLSPNPRSPLKSIENACAYWTYVIDRNPVNNATVNNIDIEICYMNSFIHSSISMSKYCSSYQETIK